MSEIIPCPLCKSEYTYADTNKMVCSQCFHEWKPEDALVETNQSALVLDANGNELKNGDSVVLIKNLPVKGSPQTLKAGTKVKNIRLTDGDHNIDCKIEGFGAMALKSIFVKKA